MNNIEKLLKKYSRDDCLDVGGGSGDFFNYFQGDFIVGVDLDRSALKFASIKGRIVLADARKLPFRSNAFDFGWSSDVIEHLPQSDTAVFCSRIKTCCEGSQHYHSNNS